MRGWLKKCLLRFVGWALLDGAGGYGGWFADKDKSYYLRIEKYPNSKYAWHFFCLVTNDQEKLDVICRLCEEKDITHEDLILIVTCLRPNEEQIRIFEQLETTAADGQ